MKKIRIGILGYGNVGKGVELALQKVSDMELVAIFTRRNPKEIKTNYCNNVISVKEIEEWKDKIDVLVLCTGSAFDLPEQGPKYAKMFNVVDSYDTHAKISEYLDTVNDAAMNGGKTAIISLGWDPGLFSLNRLVADACLPDGKTYTFWGTGVSQGHSDAIRKIDGVLDAVQFTIPVGEVVEKVRKGMNPELKAGEKHIRECYVAIDDLAKEKEIEKRIKEMPNYFLDYETIVHFVSQEEVVKRRGEMPHGGFVIRAGKTGTKDHKQVIEYKLDLESNPEFTASVLVAYARACYHLAEMGDRGAKTIYDIPPILLTSISREEIIKTIL